MPALHPHLKYTTTDTRDPALGWLDRRTSKRQQIKTAVHILSSILIFPESRSSPSFALTICRFSRNAHLRPQRTDQVQTLYLDQLI
jgi:hypothetical protein